MRLTSSRAYFRPPPEPKMPPGMVELMNGLARDVLMHNPTNVYEFCAKHMEKLLEIRDGPCSKKTLTLEQKIQKVQEKMRQKAKERREKYDKEIKLLQAASQHENKTKPLVEEISKVSENDLKAPVPHEVDLQNASEVEISHMTLSELTEHGSKENMANIVSENLLLSDKEIKTEEIDMKINKKIDDEPIFGKPLKETKLEEIVDLNALDSSLQTITETSEENNVSSTAILPTITIGDEHEMRELENISDESIKQVQSDAMKESSKIDAVENSEAIPTEVQIESDKLESNDLLNPNATDKDTFIPKNVPELEKTFSDVDHKSGEKKNGIATTGIKKQKDTTEISETSFAPINSTVDATDKKSNDHNVQQSVNNSDTNIVVDNIHTDDRTPDVKDEPRNEDLANDSTCKEAIDERQIITVTNENSNLTEREESSTITEIEQNLSTSENETSLEESSKPDCVIKTGTDDANSNIESVDIALKIEENEQTNAENSDNDNEKRQDNIENLIQSDGTENTNEGSICMVESDISKTDDDSSQNNPNMDLETAAVTIQKVFRSFMFKSRNSTFEDTINDEHNSVDEDNDKKEEYYAAAANINKERRPLGITRMDTVLQTVNEEKSLSLSTDDSSTLSSAATTIQAHVRGFLVRNRLNSSKTYSMNSLVNSHEVLEADSEQHKNKTILNIHIVPEEANYLSRDESVITSMDLSLDGSPPSSVNLHPMSCDISERRKMLKREDAVQSVSPPSNNSGKQSEDSVKEVLIDENGVLEREATDDKTIEVDEQSKDLDNEPTDVISSASTLTPTTIITISKSEDPMESPRETTEADVLRNVNSFTKLSCDESDVITPFIPSPRTPSSSEDGANLVHSGEFHDVVLPTKVSRNDTPVVRGE